MIPQAGFLFEATVRDNLDPFHLVKKDKIQSILNLGKDVVAKSLKDSMYTSSTNKIFNEELMIERGAKNLSLGEKQILNLLRVLLRDNQLILLDEATSNIDPITGTWCKFFQF
jgi:ABC-type multidrug transport system fused ATPase/permease subunit